MDYRRILVPVDGSSASAEGLKEALRLAHSPGALLRIVHVIDAFPIINVPYAGMDVSAAVEVLKRAGRSLLERCRTEAAADGLEPEIALIENLEDRVADVLVREARDWRADLLVMGTHGRRGLTRLILGSDAELVVRNSPVPVLLVRAHAAEKPARKAGRRPMRGRARSSAADSPRRGQL